MLDEAAVVQSSSSVRWEPKACVSGCQGSGGRGTPEKTRHSRCTSHISVPPPSNFFCSSNSGSMCSGLPQGKGAFPSVAQPPLKDGGAHPPSIWNPMYFHEVGGP